MRRLKAVWMAMGLAAIVILLPSAPGDERLALVGVGLVGMLGLAVTLPFAAYRLSLVRPEPGARRPPRLPRQTTRRLLTLIAVMAFAFGAAIVMRKRFPLP
jgi:hypothetical protein